MPEFDKEEEEKKETSFGDVLFESFKGYFHKRTASEKRKIKRALRRAHRGTNFNRVKPKKGYLRVKVGDKRYILKRQTPKQKITKHMIGKKLGKQTNL